MDKVQIVSSENEIGCDPVMKLPRSSKLRGMTLMGCLQTDLTLV